MISNTEQEMLDAERVCLDFDLYGTRNIAEQIGTRRIIFTGMGSSLIFPGKQAKNRALKLNIANCVESYFASDLFQYNDFSDTFVFLCSNSGETKEVILLLDHVKSRGAHCVAVTTVADSTLAKRSDHTIVLGCGFETGVAATKSVVEQGLVYDSLVFHLAAQQGRGVDFGLLRKALDETSASIKANANLTINDASLLQALVDADNYYFVGLENGVAEEVTLKSYEITRKLALYYPDTHIVHGVEEAIEGNCAIIFNPDEFERYIPDFEKFSKTTGCQLVSVGAEALLPGLQVAVNKTFANYCLLAAGWGILRQVGNHLQLDIDRPEKASKVGNPYTG